MSRDNVSFGDGVFAAVCTFFVLVIGGLVGGCTAGICSKNRFQREAVSHGAATFEPRENGVVVFKWKEVK